MCIEEPTVNYRLKKKKRKPFIIVCRFKRIGSNKWGKWSLWNRYAKLSDRNEALKTLKQNHRDSSWIQFRIGETNGKKEKTNS